jgi:hypothetical protein
VNRFSENSYLATEKITLMNRIKKLFFALLLLIFLSEAGYAQGLKSDTIDIINYHISLDLRHLSTKQLKGNTEITATPAMASITSFSLDFRKLNIDSVLLNGMLYHQFNYNDTVLYVVLPSATGIGDTFNLRVFYQGEPLIESYNWGGFHFLSDSTLAFNLGVAFQDYPHNYGRVWFPCLDDFIDRATYDVVVRTNSSHKAVSGGILQDTVHHADGSVTWHWRLDQPIPTYLASVAVGDFEILHDTCYGLEDTIPVMIFVRPADLPKAIISFSGVCDMLTVFEGRFGPYRWPRIGYTGTTKGAMEHATNIAMPRNLITGNSDYDWLIAHELGHSWFGNLMTCASSSDMWINEGWARYTEALYFEGSEGWEAYKSYIMDLQKSVLNFTHTGSSGGDGGWLPLSPVQPTHTYGSTVYDKGGLVAHTLRGYLGDSVFFDAMQAMLDHFAFKPVSSYDMRDFLTQHTGINMNPFFEGWVFTPGFPHFSIDSVRSVPYNGGWNVTVFVKQKYVGRSSLNTDNIVEIGFYESIHDYEIRRLHFSGLAGIQTFWVPYNPVLVMMDPEDRIADASTAITATIGGAGLYNFTNQFFRLRANAMPSDMMIRVEHIFVPPDSLPAPVAGLTLSPNRYWKICGLIPVGADIEGMFSYSVGNQFDQHLITNTADSLVILYRADAGDSWRSIPFVRSGAPTAGVITVSGLQMGEYVLAKWDKDHIGMIAPENIENGAIRFFPNPAKGQVTVMHEVLASCTVRIRDLSGRLVLLHPAESGTFRSEIPLKGIRPGNYILEVLSDCGVYEFANSIIIIPE